jgi:O-antigen ligase
VKYHRVVPIGVAASVIVTAFADGGYSPVFVGAAAVVLWWTVLLGIGLGVLPVVRPTRSGALALGLLSLFAAFTATSMLWTSDAGQAFDAAVRAAAYAGLFALVLLSSRRGEVQSWLYGLLIGLLVVAAAALIARLLPDLLGGDRELQRLLPSARGRLSYPIGYWNGLAACMATATVLLAWLGLAASTTRRRAAACAALPLPLLVIYLTSSRGGLAATIAGVMTVAIFSVRRSRLPAAAAVLCVALGAGVVAANEAGLWEEFKAPPRASERIQDDFVANHLISGGGSGRYQFWSAAIDAFESQPLRGIGAGGYEAWWYRNASIPYTLRNAHSLFLETLAELGAIGGLLLAGFLLLSLACAWRCRAGPAAANGTAACAGLVVAAIVSAALDWTWQLPAIFAPAIVACALLTGPACARRPLPTGAASRPGLAPALRAVACAFGLVPLLAGATLYLSQSQLEESRAAARAGRLDEAVAAATRSAAIEPWAASPRLQLALLAELEGRLRRASAELSAAIARAPEDWRLWTVRTRLLLRSGDPSQALEALNRARTLYSRSPLLRRDWANP